MESIIAKAIGMKNNPVAIIWSNQEPEKVLQYKKGKFGCVMTMYANAFKGKTAVFDTDTCGCFTGGAALGFGQMYHKWPFDIDYFYKALSEGCGKDQVGTTVKMKLKMAELAGYAPKKYLNTLIEGEGFKKDKVLVEEYINSSPLTVIKEKYVYFKPLQKIDPKKDNIAVVSFLVNADQIAALTTFVNSMSVSVNNVEVPAVPGCESIAMYPYRSLGAEIPKSIIGLLDIVARDRVKSIIGRDLMTFSMPFDHFLKLEGEVSGSCLEKAAWIKNRLGDEPLPN